MISEATIYHFTVFLFLSDKMQNTFGAYLFSTEVGKHKTKGIRIFKQAKTNKNVIKNEFCMITKHGYM